MKGISLPIEAIIIIVIALIILLSVIAIFFGVFNPTKSGIDLETAKTNACQMLTSMNCVPLTSSISVTNFDADRDGIIGDPGTNVGECNDPPPPTGGDSSQDNLYMLCKCYYAIDDEDFCKTNICRCEVD